MSIPKEPRQQMINIMYLVLIALLALNVSAEILNAFKMLRKGIEGSQFSLSEKINNTMASFEAKVKKEGRGQEYLTAAGKAREISAEFVAYMDSVDADLFAAVGEHPEQPGELLKSDDQDTPTRIFVDEGKGVELEAKINETRDKFLSLFKDKAEREGVANVMTLKVDSIPPESDKKTWAEYTFFHMPAEAVRTLISKFKNDAVAAEATVIDELYGKVGEKTVIFDKYKAAIVPNSRKFIQGEQLEVEVFLAASSSKDRPSITAGGQSLPLNAEGVGTYKKTVNSVGDFTLNVSVSSKDTKGQMKTYKNSMKYSVVSPADHAPIVSADKMNVFYIGVPNPITCGITGIRPDKVNVNVSGGTASRGGGAGKYSVTVSRPGKATVSLSGTNSQGKTVNGSKEFRVKRIPDPVPEIGGKSGGKMGTGEWKAQLGVAAILKDFDFDAKFLVQGFEMTLSQRGEDLQICTNGGSKFKGQCKALQSKAKVGDIYFIDNIRAKGPDGTTRKLPTISFKIM